MSAKLVDNKKQWNKLLKQSAELKKGPVVGVGYPANKVQNSIIAYATYNHFGIPFEQGTRIPARPFLTVTIDKNNQKIFALKAALASKILGGQLDVKTALNQLGSIVTGMVKQTLSGPIFKAIAPNAPSTIRAKGSSQPLIHHGTMRSATTWEVYMKGKPNG